MKFIHTQNPTQDDPLQSGLDTCDLERDWPLVEGPESLSLFFFWYRVKYLLIN